MGHTDRSPRRLRLPSNLPDYLGYGGMHVTCLGALWTGASRVDLLICLVSYLVRMFGLVAGFHRYFAHRSYKMSRPAQFLMALLGTLAVQKGVLWWSEYHRHHHRFSDTIHDIHSPYHRHFLYAHAGWFLDSRHRATDPSKVPDLARFPELVWLNDWGIVPVLAFMAILLASSGLSGLIWGFFVSTILLWHAIHSIGTFGHKYGGWRRYATDDESRNHFVLAILTLGEGWHNNHHYYPVSARQGFVWWEIDITYYILKGLSWIGLVWDIKTPPPHVLVGDRAGYQRQVALVQTSLSTLRRDIDSTIDEAAFRLAAGRGIGSEAIARVKHSVTDRLDLFGEAVFDHLVQGPQELQRASSFVFSDIVAITRRILPGCPEGRELESITHPLERNIQHFLESCRSPRIVGAGPSRPAIGHAPKAVTRPGSADPETSNRAGAHDLRDRWEPETDPPGDGPPDQTPRASEGIP